MVIVQFRTAIIYLNCEESALTCASTPAYAIIKRDGIKMGITENRVQKILEVHKEVITSPSDLFADQPPSLFSLVLGMRYRKWFDVVSDEECMRTIVSRRKTYPIIKALLPHFMAHKQIVENRESLRRGINSEEPDTGISLPNESIIWMGNHGFKDDTAATLAAAYRQCFILFGSIPQFYNTFDGLAAGINGSIMVNRKSKNSTKTAVQRASQLLRLGMDLMMFPEGVWNKTPNQLILPLWPGIYRISQETGAKIVPVIHYLPHHNPESYIHTVIDDPVCIDGMSEQEALMYLRDIMAGWYFLMMERYGRTTRDELVKPGSDSRLVWENYLKRLVETADRYDCEIELKADYRPRSMLQPEAVWEPIAGIEHITACNIKDMLYAKALIEQCQLNDFQRRF